MLAFIEEGLVDVQTTVTGSAWRGGGPGCELVIAGIGQLREELLRTGWTTPSWITYARCSATRP